MTGLQWSAALQLDYPQMDNTHQEFVALLAQARQADDARLLYAWNTLITHTDAHFAQEDRWMHTTRFATSNCHSGQHKVVLQVMREVASRGEQGDLPLVRQMVQELGLWFSQHAQSMDAALALHLRRVGLDACTEMVQFPEGLPAHLIHGCGSHACTPEPAESLT